MTTESVDTNVLLRAAIDLGDEQTRRARVLLADPDRRFLVSLLVIAEFVHALTSHYAMTRPQAAAIVGWVMDIESVICPRDLIASSMRRYVAHPKLSLEDCLIADQARACDATPLWTFDVKLARQHPVATLVT
ncbi:MAG: PIN domain-containing protein [Propionibacteriaceae bacterium]|nr:PIN domain-containing protein [Propionibacteriaceae bacterium]